MNVFKIDTDILKLADESQKSCEYIFKKIEDIYEHNQIKILSSFIKNKVCESDFNGSTGYGYDDKGREKLDKVWADIFNSEDALVRHNFVSGTHAITVALFAILRPGELMVSITGNPYDTLKDVIGINRSNKIQGSLKEFGIKYDQVDLDSLGNINYNLVLKKCKEAKVVYIQRSRGYSFRKSISIKEIKKVVDIIKNENSNIIIIVDNCYGEFVEKIEPTDVGVDLIAGSLIKNPGGGITKSGGYIAGRADLIEFCGSRLTAPGLGKHVGCTLNELRDIFLGLYLSPQITANALKTAVFASKFFENLGMEVYPRFDEYRSDIVQTIKLSSKEGLIAFCRGIQKNSPIDSFLSPIPWDMPGYDSQIIMAAGTFTMGSSIELSADAPLREPFAVWMQGALTYYTGKIGVISAAQELKDQVPREFEGRV